MKILCLICNNRYNALRSSYEQPGFYAVCSKCRRDTEPPEEYKCHGRSVAWRGKNGNGYKSCQHWRKFGSEKYCGYHVGEENA
jgi:hypothetical protein